ncbi:maleylpyruvate isomerase N-terminal domain-containing protein [Streptomyces sp. RB110-1]|uniref:maleylpyruvate isomerase N-terminal domain-containing protein n=1 Tax=unclassified Streptomyces TaxID=2593676 RepID=UPI00190121CD|nr:MULTISPECIES: maleylpyruvate isomerase N-terminal domain-containing protein [unclassified Streptomyces]MBK0375206.1 maleylpyruvate isomerase N-terminal domain-containing protein [Streptomyces sp. RB110-1]MBK0388420.1 maleylpyruvate isomerase N-terminal domain-containing protein [Streptomyces sp. RB110-2]
MTGDGRASEGDEDGVRGARRIPGPRGAADDLDLAAVPLPPLPPPGAGTPGEAVPEQPGAEAPGQPVPEQPGADAAAPDDPAEPERDAPDDPAEPEPDACEPAESEPEPHVCGPTGPEPEPDAPGADRVPASTPADGGPAPASGCAPAPVPDPGPGPEPYVSPAPEPCVSAAPVLPHRDLQALLGAWALSVCSAEETAAVENHLPRCLPCADEAKRLREAVGLLHSDGALDLDATLRSRVVEGCLARRPARIPIPGWAAPYDAETARLDALLRDIGDADWDAQVRLRWFEKERRTDRWTTVGGVISHLTAVDGLLSAALGLDDPLGGRAPLDPTERTEASWAAVGSPARAVREPWRAQSHELIRTASFAGRNVAETSVSYGSFALPLQDALVDRAFECWVHGWDIAEAVAYPYPAPSAAHLHLMIDLAARMLPAALAGRRRAGLAGPARDLVVPGEPGRSLHLEIEGHAGGDWYIALDSPAALGTRETAVAQVALDAVEFCRLVAGHISPAEAAAGQEGDREAISDVLFAAASLSRL